jgi:hypothetical protein
MRSALATLLVALAATATACAPGSAVPTGGGPPGLDPDVQCQATLTVTGTFAASGAPGADGCYPDGTWTVHATVADAGGCADVPVAAEYVYTVTTDAQGKWQVMYSGSDGGDVQLGMSATGDGLCEGSFVHTFADGLDELLLKPTLQAGALAGSGTFTRFKP